MYLQEKYNELSQYLPPLTKQADFDEFWDRTIRQARQVPLKANVEEYPYSSPYVDVYTVTYCGFDETPIHGWYLVPKFAEQSNLPCLIHYHGLGGSRGVPGDYLKWTAHGIAVFAIDCRGQRGVTPDWARYHSGMMGNVTLRGILNKEEYYFRGVYMDCLKAVDFVCQRAEVDPDQIILEGGSQGGALVSAISALDDRPCMALADVPSNSNITARVEGKNGSFGVVQEFLNKYPQHTDRVLTVLSYFDTMNMADRIHCPTLASVGLQDTTCPALHYFATYNRIPGEKEIRLYPFNGHEGGHAIHSEEKLKFVMEHLKR